MKYRYGNSMKEAMSNPPIDIKSTTQLEQYKECYNVVVPDDGKESYIILREEDYSTERWYEICDILGIPHESTKASVVFDPGKVGFDANLKF